MTKTEYIEIYKRQKSGGLNINDYGFYTMIIFANVFFLEVSPRAELTRDIFLKKESRKLIETGFIFNSLKKIKIITDIDFTFRKLRQKR